MRQYAKRPIADRFWEKVERCGDGRAKLTEIDVIAMREARAKGMSTAELARIYGVHEMTASHAIRGLTWKHVEA